MEKTKKAVSKTAAKVKTDNEIGARKDLLQELFQDFNRSRGQVYRMNFTRGIFFGLGSVIGGTLVVALVLAMLGFLVDLPGGVGDFVQYIVNIVRDSQ